MIRLFLIRLLALVALTIPVLPAAAQESNLRSLINALAEGGFNETANQVKALAATGNTAVAPTLNALSDGDLYFQKSDKLVVIAKSASGGYALTDPLTGESLGNVARGAVERIRVNNSLRRVIRSALGSITLLSPNPATRRQAAEAVFKSGDPDVIEVLDQALAKEEDSDVAQLMREARAAAVLKSDLADSEKFAAIDVLRQRGGRDSASILIGLSSSEGTIGEAAAAANDAIQAELRLWEAGQNVWYGISLGSVLVLAAIGLAITFGVMGVINMAHGEMVMLGAYTTFTVQEIIRTHAPALFDWSLLISLPLAFVVAGAVGILIERSVIRWLYTRPLETLLATWGISLILQQAVRTIFGASNREVGNPDWMAGAFQLGGLTITYSRLWIVVFMLLVVAALMLVMRFTAFGLQMRAVTQNRTMASSMGIRTARVDALTFGLGSGIAGIAGVALSQIDNVSPNLGQGYIVDSFMVVVFGGVGNLWGTLVGGLTLGIANKFLEPYAGAVLGKILVLIFIILFIQKRPRGLFAQRGRAVEA